MILQLFISLCLLALLAFIFGNGSRRRLWSMIIAVGGAVIFYHLFQIFQLHDVSGFVFNWLPFKNLNASLYLSGGYTLEKMLIPLLASALVLIYFNTIYQPEAAKLVLNGLLLLSVAAFILIISSQDFIQLMAGSCIYTILGFYLINNIEVKKKFIFYNFIGEMALFTALAIVYSQTGSLNLDKLAGYGRTGVHKDLIAVLLMIAVFTKAGLFPFQNQLMDIQELTFNRVISFLTFSTPLASLIIFLKINPLFMGADFSATVLKIVIVVSLLWGFLGSLVIDNIKAKVLYLNLMFYAFSFALLSQNLASLSNTVIYLLPAMTGIYLLMLIVIVAASNEIYISQMGHFISYLKYSFVLTLIGIYLWLEMFDHFYQPGQQFCYLGFVTLTQVSFAHILRQIYWGKSHADERVEALLKNASVVYLLPLTLLAGAGIYYFSLTPSREVLIAFILFLLVLILGPFCGLNRFNENEIIQEADWLDKIYNLFILMPVRLLGRILWITVDFLFIERTIIGSISQTTSFLVSGLQKIQSAVWLNYLLMVMLGLGIIIFAAGYHYYE